MRVLDNDALKVAMQMKKVTALQVATAIGVDPQTIYHYTCGSRTPTLKHLVAICQFLYIKDVNQILLPEGEKPEEPISST